MSFIGMVTMKFIIFIFLFFINFANCSILDEYNAVQAYKKGDYSKSEKLFEKVIINNPVDVQNMFNLGNAFYKSGEFQKAGNYFEKVTQAKNISNQQKE